MKYYHLTTIDNMDSILENGLLAQADTRIFLFTNLAVASSIAVNQVGIPQGEEFAVFEIHADGITADVENDDVCELTAKYQFYIKQEVIHPQYIKLLYEDELLSDDDLRIYNEDYFAVCDRLTREEHVGKEETLTIIQGLKYRSWADISLLDDTTEPNNN